MRRSDGIGWCWCGRNFRLLSLRTPFSYFPDTRPSMLDCFAVPEMGARYQRSCSWRAMVYPFRVLPQNVSMKDLYCTLGSLWGWGWALKGIPSAVMKVSCRCPFSVGQLMVLNDYKMIAVRDAIRGATSRTTPKASKCGTYEASSSIPSECSTVGRLGSEWQDVSSR